jgi:hypothetical protein
MQDALQEYKKQLDALKEDLKIVAKYSNSLRNSIISESNRTGPDQAAAKAFRNKYGIRVG